MIPNILIKNFKTIKELQFDCKRLNLFIGDANTGKSNILEAFSLLNFHQELSKLFDFMKYPICFMSLIRLLG